MLFLIRKKYIIFIAFIFSFFGYSSANLNSHGVVGILNTPSARINDESTIALSVYRGTPDSKLILSATPFSWLEASLFYTDVSNKPYVAWNSDYIFENQSYKDKGFNFKFKLLEETYNRPAVSVGVNDLGGTGLYASEYLVISKMHSNFDFSLGIGFGLYSEGIKISNPLTKISSRFDERSDPTSGELNFNSFFSGEDSSIFGSVKYYFNNNYSLFFEYDPTDYNQRIDYEINDDFSRLNFGGLYSTDRFSIKAAVERGTDFTLQFSLKNNFLNFNPNPINRASNFNSASKEKSLAGILGSNSIGLKKVSKANNKININIRQSIYEDSRVVDNLVISEAKRLYGNDKTIELKQTYLGMDVSEVIVKSYSTKKNYTKITYQDKSKDEIYSSTDKFPYYFNNFSIKPRFFLGAREGFFYRGLFAEFDSEVVLKDNLILSSNLKYPITSNFGGLTIPPVDTFPNQVRSDVKRYLNEMGNQLSIGRLQADYFFNIDHNFFNISAGIFEEMFSGVGLEYLNSKKNRLINYGFESFYVKKRDYEMQFQHQDYDNFLSRFNVLINEPNTSVFVKLSYGEYLAGDKGYTLDVSRKFNNGIEFGFFFTRTDVSKEDYGEGSFDKGVRLVFPISSLFGDDRASLSEFIWRPLTKDPGALLIRKLNLSDELTRFRRK